MPRPRYSIRKVQLWDDAEYDLGFDLRIIQSSSGAVLPVPTVPDVHITICVKTASRFLGHFNIHQKNEKTREHQDFVDIDLIEAAERLASQDIITTLQERLLRACYPVDDPLQLQSIGISWLMPVPTARGALPMPEGTDVMDISLLRPVGLLAPWESPPGSVWAPLDDTGAPVGLLFSAESARGSLVRFIPWDRCLAIGHWFMREFAGPNALLPSR